MTLVGGLADFTVLVVLGVAVAWAGVLWDYAVQVGFHIVAGAIQSEGSRSPDLEDDGVISHDRGGRTTPSEDRGAR